MAKKARLPGSGAGGSWRSIASRATSAIDVPRRRASSRSRSSRSSGSMMVVRLTHTAYRSTHHPTFALPLSDTIALVDVAPGPLVAGFERADDGVAGRVRMGGRGVV